MEQKLLKELKKITFVDTCDSLNNVVITNLGLSLKNEEITAIIKFRLQVAQKLYRDIEVLDVERCGYDLDDEITFLVFEKETEKGFYIKLKFNG